MSPTPPSATAPFQRLLVRFERGDGLAPSRSKVVHVLSGPGTFREALRPEQPEWQAWLGKDRMDAGRKLLGPEMTLFYNGNPEENADVRAYAEATGLHSLVVQDTVTRDGNAVPIKRTSDQMDGLVELLSMPGSPLFGKSKILIVSTTIHGPRVALCLGAALARHPVAATFSFHGVAPRSMDVRMQCVRYELDVLKRDALEIEPYDFSRVTVAS